jgi:two-component system chemotaxis response regulator CheB
MNERTRVLVVDDSALMRELLAKVLSLDPDIEVVGTARDGASGLAAVDKWKPDVITLDVEMPGISGLEVLTRLKGKDVSVIVVSSVGESSSEITVQALTLGAFDFFPKPNGAAALAALGPDLSAKVKAAAAAKRRFAKRTPLRAPVAPASPSGRPPARTTPSSMAPRREARPISVLPTARGGGRQLIALGASTGGPEALGEVIRAFPADVPPVLIVQHMPEAFTAKFAQRLDSRCAATVQEAKDGTIVRPGLVLLAPGSKRHMILARSGHDLVVRLIESDPVMHHRPSIDVLFNSVADVLGRRAIAALLTGMGADGARGLLALRRAGAVTVGQDEATSVVYGMPMEAAALGAVMHVLPLEEIGPNLMRLALGGSIRNVA